MAAVWPSTLPVSPLVDGYNESVPNTLKRTTVDQGPPRVRRKCTNRQWPMSVKFMLTRDQVAILETFAWTTLDGGALRFEFSHPRKGTSVECRITPKSDTELYGIIPHGSGLYFDVVLALEVLP